MTTPKWIEEASDAQLKMTIDRLRNGVWINRLSSNGKWEIQNVQDEVVRRKEKEKK